MARRTANVKAFRILTAVDGHNQECVTLKVKRELDATRVLETLAELLTSRGPPEQIRSDNGPEFCVSEFAEFADLFRDAGRRRFDLVLFWSLDRFSREGITKTIAYLQQLDAAGSSSSP